MAALAWPRDLDRRELYIVRHSGPWQRLYDSEYSPLYFGKKRENRFDDPKGKYGVLYVAEDEFGAFVETFLREPELEFIAEDVLRVRQLCEIEASEELALVDLTGEGVQHAGVRGDVSTAPHEEVQPLSRALYEHSSRPDGIRYRLLHDLSRIGVAIFERASVEGRERVLRTEDRGNLLDPSHSVLLGNILEKYKKALI